MELRLGPIPSHSVICRGVQVPADEIESRVVKCHAGEGGVNAFGMVESEGCSVSPVVEVAGHVVIVAREIRLVEL